MSIKTGYDPKRLVEELEDALHCELGVDNLVQAVLEQQSLISNLTGKVDKLTKRVDTLEHTSNATPPVKNFVLPQAVVESPKFKKINL
jgi:uncharacterized coiled-coil protein SlyX